jgi:hypothetical protein
MRSHTVVWLSAFATLACSSCSSSSPTSDGGKDGAVTDAASTDATSTDAAPTSDCAAPAVDASYSCDVSSVPPGGLSCDEWISDPASGGVVGCPGALDWSTLGLADACGYKWSKPGPPNVCELPSKDGMGPFQWLHPACDAGCQ